MTNVKLWFIRFLPARLARKLGVLSKQIRNFRILAFGYGQFASIESWSCVDRHGESIPWYTYSALEYLSEFDFRSADVFEFGSGRSTVWWLKRARRVVSVEQNPEWHESVRRMAGSQSFEYILDTGQTYPAQLSNYPRTFDVMIIDGSYRGFCARSVVGHIERYDGILLILDNSDWYPKTLNYIRSNLHWIEVNFHGFGPINAYTTTTTIFINQARARLLQKTDRLRSVAAIEQVGEDDF